MKRDFFFVVSGTFFGLLVGWILGSQQAGVPVPVPPTSQAAQTAGADPQAQAPPAIDEQRVNALQQTANGDPANAAARTELGNLYSDSRRYDLAIPWYEAAFKLRPKDADLSTDLAVAYYSTNQTDLALAQLDKSLAINPRHLKAMLNQGVVRAFGKRDPKGAAASWQHLIDVAPDSEEAKIAKQGLDDLRAAHPELAGPGRSGAGG
jgi:tetratricopeptide (TPR) repeat protein